VLVTGATGFLGFRLCERLASQGWSVKGFGRHPKRLEALARLGVMPLAGDLRDPEALEAAVQGVTAVVHAGARSDLWGTRREFWETNVEPTRQLVGLAREHGVGRFVFVSSPSVGFELRHMVGVKESDPLPRPFNEYARSKEEAEAVVSAEAGLSRLIVRRQAIFGPGDTSLLPRLLRVARRFGFPQLGDDSPWVDLTYVDNVAYALELALRSPLEGVVQITNGEPWRLGQAVATVLSGLGLPWRPRRLPRAPLLAAAAALEAWHRRFAPEQEPVLTRYAVGVLAFDRTLDISRATRELGYRPLVSVADGLARVIQAGGHHGL